MIFKSRTFFVVLTAATCLSPLTALAQSAVDPSGIVNYLRDAGKVDDEMTGAPDVAGSGFAVPGTGGVVTDAGSAATDSAGAVGTCDAYFTKSQSMSTDLSTAFTAMNPKDPAKMAAILPALQRHLDSLPAAEVRAEVCNGNHINAYTTYQNVVLGVQRDKGIDTGFPAILPVVKQPELNHSSVAYTVGWIKYEQGDFPGALAAFNKGLIMFPHNHPLQNEYLATLVQMQNGPGIVAYAEKILSQTYDLDDTMRGKVWAAHGLGLFFSGKVKEADDSLSVSLRYNYDPSVVELQTALKQAAGQ
ncbi:hypothetical protein ABAC460_12625 [Asticcacaulis sp. AC460]|uniref:hypothetical protein n=1 Tax=Asticcacaulis sp. AC460 TaxID=1282360 RepID=UPI0003C3F52D|nr:hypothetical protein [Asticcacaulis sp. AC460]ESQ89705.1 hypothetical protein ABAC460_12625 [Asticcacaulis sp. AC460]